MTELAAEHARLAASRAAFARMLDTARHRVATGEAVAGDRYTAETLGRMLKSHVKELTEEPDGPLYFGRLQFGTGPEAGEHGGQRYYIGRRHVPDPGGGDPMVVDWRAPVSRAFYRASHRDPQGVLARRRYGWSPAGELTGYEDEPLAAAGPGAPSRLVIEEIERPRVGPMRDIVATIQPDQDELVRADIEESVCVQGAPGTGKTAVGLHRAAYLLYTHRQRLRRGGVLVVGPNPAFLRYIAAVLPALGEVDVRQTTVDDLLGTPVSAVDTPDAAAVKHDARMATVLARALRRRIGTPGGPLVVPDGSMRWRVSEDALARLVAEVRADGSLYGVGRERLRARVVDLLTRQAERRGETPGAVWAQRMGRSPSVKAFLAAVWPAVRPAELVAEVLSDPSAAADGVLTAEEQAAIRWRRPVRPRSARWTAADAVLLDEAAGLMAHPEGFGHIVVDEAQDLSPMQCRVLARRSVHASLTVLGDLAQGTTPWAARDWATQLAHLGKPAARVVPLTAGFRVPAAVIEVANRLLPSLGVAVPPARSVRRDGTVRHLPGGDPAAAVREALALAGSVGVIAADETALSLAGLSGDRVSVVPASLAQGLEFDHVVLVEPAEIAAGPRGRNLLYVALTRAVSRLDIVHTHPLPF